MSIVCRLLWVVSAIIYYLLIKLTFKVQSWREFASIVMSDRQQVLSSVSWSLLLLLWCQTQSACCSSWRYSKKLSWSISKSTFAWRAKIDGQGCGDAAVFADFDGCFGSLEFMIIDFAREKGVENCLLRLSTVLFFGEVWPGTNSATSGFHFSV